MRAHESADNLIAQMPPEVVTNVTLSWLLSRVDARRGFVIVSCTCHGDTQRLGEDRTSQLWVTIRDMGYAPACLLTSFRAAGRGLAATQQFERGYFIANISRHDAHQLARFVTRELEQPAILYGSVAEGIFLFNEGEDDSPHPRYWTITPTGVAHVWFRLVERQNTRAVLRRRGRGGVERVQYQPSSMATAMAWNAELAGAVNQHRA